MQFQPSNPFLAQQQGVSKWEQQPEGDGAEITGAKDVADAAQGREADKMTLRHLPSTNRNRSSKDEETERAVSSPKDRKDSSHRHHPGVTINQQCPRSIL